MGVLKLNIVVMESLTSKLELELEQEQELVLDVNCGRHWRWKRENGRSRNRDSLGYQRNYDSHTDSEEDGYRLIGRWR